MVMTQLFKKRYELCKNCFWFHSKFSGQLPYVSKCEISGMGGVLKNVNVALCGMLT